MRGSILDQFLVNTYFGIDLDCYMCSYMLLYVQVSLSA